MNDNYTVLCNSAPTVILCNYSKLNTKDIKISLLFKKNSAEIFPLSPYSIGFVIMDFPFVKIYNDSKVEIRAFKRNLRPKEVALMMVFAHRVIRFTNQQLSVSYPYSKLGELEINRIDLCWFPDQLSPFWMIFF